MLLPDIIEKVYIEKFLKKSRKIQIFCSITKFFTYFWGSTKFPIEWWKSHGPKRGRGTIALAPLATALHIALNTCIHTALNPCIHIGDYIPAYLSLNGELPFCDIVVLPHNYPVFGIKVLVHPPWRVPKWHEIFHMGWNSYENMIIHSFWSPCPFIQRENRQMNFASQWLKYFILWVDKQNSVFFSRKVHPSGWNEL